MPPLLLVFLSNPHAKSQQTRVILPSNQIPDLATSHPQPTSFLIQASTSCRQLTVTATNEPSAPTPKFTLTPTARGTPLHVSQIQPLLHSKQDLPLPPLCPPFSPSLHYSPSNRPSLLLPQGLCTGHLHCLEYLSPGRPHGSHSHLLQVSAQMSPTDVLSLLTYNRKPPASLSLSSGPT